MQLAQTRPANRFAQGVFNFCGCESHRQILELIVIQGQDDKSQILECCSGEMFKSRLGERLGQLDLALSSPAAENDRIPLLDSTERIPISIGKNDRIEGVIALAS